MFHRMIRPTALFVPASILLTVVACGQRPDFKKNDPKWAIGNGIYLGDESSAAAKSAGKSRLGPDYEGLDYSHYEVKDGVLSLLNISEACGEKSTPVGELKKKAGIEYELTLDSALQADQCLVAEMGPSYGAAGLVAWAAGGKVKAKLHEGLLRLTNARGETRSYRQTPTTSAETLRRKVGDAQAAKRGLIIKFMEAVKNRKFELTQRIVFQKDQDTIVKIDDPEGSTVTPGEDSDRPADADRQPNAVKTDGKAPLGNVAVKNAAGRMPTPAEVARALEDQRRREQRSKPVPIPAEKIEPKEKLSNGKIKINIRKLVFVDEKNVLINDEHKGTVRYHLRRKGRGERRQGLPEELLELEIKLAVDEKVYDIAASEKHMRGVAQFWDNGRQMRLIMRDRAAKTFFANDFKLEGTAAGTPAPTDPQAEHLANDPLATP